MRKSKKIKLIIVLVVAIITYLVKQVSNKKNHSEENAKITKEEIVTINHNNFDFLPTSTTGQIVRHKGYSLSYSEKHEQAEWVAYSLDKSDIVYTNRVRPYFYKDPKVKTKSAHWKSYKKSGYDRGHLCPAGDRKRTEELYNETFLTSNISPQIHSFNAGIWNVLEQKVRYWAKKYDHLYVVSGGILTDKNMKTIGKDKVSVPHQFYKIILDYTEPEIKAIAFLLPHKNSNRPLYEYVVSIDMLEQKTGIDFFPNLPNDIETKLESSKNYKNWAFR